MGMRKHGRLFALTVTVAIAGSVFSSVQVKAADCTKTSIGATPLTELGTGFYQGYQGGLYPGGSNVRPMAHDAAGIALAQSIVPLDLNGNPDSVNGKYVLLSIGYSGTTQEFSHFTPIGMADPDKDPKLLIVDGAQNGKGAHKWANFNDSAWGVMRGRLAAANASTTQVTAVWFKAVNSNPPSFPGHVLTLQDHYTTIMQNLKNEFPNLKVVYLASEIYAGYSSKPTLYSEPFAYESSFATKWLIEDQLNGLPELNYNPAVGPVMAPWMSWGPYLWADGLNPRADGLTWICNDFSSDGVHRSNTGTAKVSQMLLDFFKTDTTASEWFLATP